MASKNSGSFQNFVHSYGGRMWNDSDVQEAKAIDAAMKQYDSQQGGSAKSSGGAAKSSGGSSKSTSSRK